MGRNAKITPVPRPKKIVTAMCRCITSSMLARTHSAPRTGCPGSRLSSRVPQASAAATAATTADVKKSGRKPKRLITPSPISGAIAVDMRPDTP